MITDHIVDVVNVKKMLDVCPHYDEIINCDIDYDEISSSLIDWYKDFIFACNGEDKADTKIAKKIDNCMYMYVCDYKLRKGLNKIICLDDFLEDKDILVDKILKYTDQFQNLEFLNMKNSKWL